MTQRRKPKPTLADITFLRSMVTDSKEVLQLRHMLNRRVMALRLKLVERIVSALIGRYKKYHKHDENAPELARWLDELIMEESYHFHGPETRALWANRPIRLARTSRFSFDGSEGDDSWYYVMFEEILNRRVGHSRYWIHVHPDFSNISDAYPDNPTLRFTFALRNYDVIES